MATPRGVIKIFASPFSGHYRRRVTALMSAQRGASYLDFAGLTFLMLIVFIVLGRYVFTGSKEIYTDPYGVTINYGQSRSEASLVIIGKITRAYQKSQE